MLQELYKNIYYLGLKSGYLLRNFFKFCVDKIKIPFKALGTFFLAGFLLLDKSVFQKCRAFFKRLGTYWHSARRAAGKLRTLKKTDAAGYKALYSAYLQKLNRHKKAILMTAFNVILPVLMFVLLCSTVGFYQEQTLALEVKYNDAVLGYVSSEKEFHEAQENAVNRLSTVAKAEHDKDERAARVTFAVKPVKRSEIQDSNVLSDELLKRSTQKTTNACGVYINDEFLCAVKNETDATTVFDSILRNYKTGNPNDMVGFTQKISYVQGLYPDTADTVWDADRLSERLHSKKEAAEYYTCVAGDTLSGIASKFDLKIAQLKVLNPGLTENIHIGDRLLVSREVSYIQVQVTKTEVRSVSLPYETVKEENKKLYSGQKRTKTKGQNGEQRVTELVTYVDGVRISAKEISRETVKEPVTEVIQVGSKKTPSYAGGPVGPYTTTSYGGRFIWPTVGAYNISSPFGGRRHHGGIDIVKPGGRSAGTLVVAAGSGRVVKAGRHSSYGNYVVIDHGGGVHTLYAHMLNGSLKVRAGQQVSAGQAIGNIGETGRAYGAHLHFEVRVNNGRTRVNPLPYLKR